MQSKNVFAGPYLDRVGHLRGDRDWFESILQHAQTRALPIWKYQSLIAQGDTLAAATLEIAAIPKALRNADHLVLLGRMGDIHYLAYDIQAGDPPVLLPNTRFQDVRLIAAQLPDDQAGMLAYARAMIYWRHRHRYCGSCGARTAAEKSGHVLVCTNPECRHEQFPRLDPAIIVLVTDGERALLGRQATWPAGRYSTIAGFVEPGESLEDAVAREVLEETGIQVEDATYRSSQPWPFPSSLMLGYTARAVSREIQLNDAELEEARWFSRDEIRASSGLLPPQQSISFSLIEHWFNAGGSDQLRDLPGNLSWSAPR